ncbi:hypothetical protein [Tateyamaria sp. ANG-S1]|uniref:hypothetical protein n=1 Tax=Tateyamaria sp. ANG-S1 TaxID=1577905 RepID=UPI00126A4086|nr:hypothetical protein [Tateyamaria sp. ANG-S1]
MPLLQLLDIETNANVFAEEEPFPGWVNIRHEQALGLALGLINDALFQAENSLLQSELAYLNAVSDLDEKMGTTLGTWGIDVDRLFSER